MLRRPASPSPLQKTQVPKAQLAGELKLRRPCSRSSFLRGSAPRFAATSQSTPEPRQNFARLPSPARPNREREREIGTPGGDARWRALHCSSPSRLMGLRAVVKRRLRRHG